MLQASQRTLVSQTAGLVKADEGASSRLDALEASVATLTAANKALTTTVTALQSDNTKLKADRCVAGFERLRLYY